MCFADGEHSNHCNGLQVEALSTSWKDTISLQGVLTAELPEGHAYKTTNSQLRDAILPTTYQPTASHHLIKAETPEPPHTKRFLSIEPTSNGILQRQPPRRHPLLRIRIPRPRTPIPTPNPPRSCRMGSRQPPRKRLVQHLRRFLRVLQVQRRQHERPAVEARRNERGARCARSRRQV